MKMLLSTTALVVALGFPALTLAQSSAPEAKPASQAQSAEVSGFLSTRAQADLFASDLIGQDVYARRDHSEMSASDDMNGEESRDMATMNRADLDDMDNIGQINEIVLSTDGKVRALVIGVGGFLGIGEHNVAVTMDQVSFRSDADDEARMYIVVNTGADMLTDAPAYDKMSAKTGPAKGTDEESAMRDDEPRAERNAFAAPEMEREGYGQIEVDEVTTELLMGKTVYDVNDTGVGTVTDMVLDDAGAITDVIIDFGGFLGIGSSQVALGYDELTILTNEGYEDVRLYVDASKKQIQELPLHVPAD